MKVLHTQSAPNVDPFVITASYEKVPISIRESAGRDLADLLFESLSVVTLEALCERLNYRYQMIGREFPDAS